MSESTGPAGSGEERGAPLTVPVDDQTRAVLEEIRRGRGPEATLADVVRDALSKYAAGYLAGRESPRAAGRP